MARSMMPTLEQPPPAPPPSPGEPAPSLTSWYRMLPNALTIARVGMAAVFFCILIAWSIGRGPTAYDPPDPGHPDAMLLVAAAVFVLAALTDALDGHLARRWQVITPFGRVMDPFADKVLVLGAFIFLAGPGFGFHERINNVWFRTQTSGIYPWMVVVFLSRELLVTSIRGVLEGQGVAFPADRAGKVKMVVQSVAVPTILSLLAIADASPNRPARIMIDGIAWLTLVATVVSGVPYMLRAARAFKQIERGAGA